MITSAPVVAAGIVCDCPFVRMITGECVDGQEVHS